MSRMFRLTEEQYEELLKKKKPAMPVVAIESAEFTKGQWNAIRPTSAVKAPLPGPSQIHIRMRQQIQQAGLPPPIEEYYHIKGRDFRLDFAWPDRKIGVEVQGMAHRIKGKFHADIEKRALAMLQGWRILEVSGDTVRDERGIGWLKQLLEKI